MSFFLGKFGKGGGKVNGGYGLQKMCHTTDGHQMPVTNIKPPTWCRGLVEWESYGTVFWQKVIVILVSFPSSIHQEVAHRFSKITYKLVSTKKWNALASSVFWFTGQCALNSVNTILCPKQTLYNCICEYVWFCNNASFHSLFSGNVQIEINLFLPYCVSRKYEIELIWNCGQ